MFGKFSDEMTFLYACSPCLYMRPNMASLSPPPEWLKEWAVVAAELTAVAYALFRIIRAVA